MKTGPIIVVEDDAEDEEMFMEILNELNIPNKVIWFTNAESAFKFLKTTEEKPYIIFCDVNIPGQSGIEFKKNIDCDPQLRKKSIPFVFYSTSVNQKLVNEAYTEMTVQGFFRKAISYAEMKSDIKLILDYWSQCKHPNTK
jgi:CheY-like chemotaxis protein